MDDSEYPVWQADVALADPAGPVAYKYAIRRAGRIAMWEAGADRALAPGAAGPADGRLTVVSDESFRYPADPWRGAGVSVPVFSLRSREGMGVGEFQDIRHLADWARAVGLRLIQVLPVNDTTATRTWADSRPHAAISAFALHPLYMSLDRLAEAAPGLEWDDLRAARDSLNALPELDYEKVMDVKWQFFRRAYRRGRDAMLADPAFTGFLDRNRDWLLPYAVFCCLRDRHGTCDTDRWEGFARPDMAQLERFASPREPHFDEVAIHYFVQFHLHRQLLDAAEYARSRGVALKGEIQIGVSRHGVDAWIAPWLFHMDRQAGAPPDEFSQNGRNWRFPTYDWDAMARERFAWWRARLRRMAVYFDAVRIDHVPGFFRTWEIPGDQVEGVLGRFSPSLPLSRGEIESWLGWFDRDRLCEPFIRGHMLDAAFGACAADAAREFLEETSPGVYRLRPGFRTQRDAETRFQAAAGAPPEQRQRDQAMRSGLFSLVSDVLFLEEPGSAGQAFHPRHSLHRTRSFADLDPATRARLDELYVHYFNRRHEQFWKEKALEKLPAVADATDMLICGEDLGAAPDCVAGVMRELGILGLSVQRMPKDPRREFHHPSDTAYLSVTSTGTHDMSPLRAWWEEDRERTARFYRRMLGRDGPPPYFAESWVCRDIVAQHLYSPSLWGIFPLQDLLALDASVRRESPWEERVNVPGNPRHYWRYRMHLDLESLREAKGFNDLLRGLVREAGRDQEI
jgi:4-alpha-glucanotransferase